MTCRWCKGTRKIALETCFVDCTECEPEVIMTSHKRDLVGHAYTTKGTNTFCFVAKKLGWYSDEATKFGGSCLYEGPQGPVRVTCVTSLLATNSGCGWSDIICVGPVGEFISSK